MCRSCIIHIETLHGIFRQGNVVMFKFLFWFLCLVPPRIEETSRIVTIREGATASLPCKAHGYPTPQLKWRKNGRRFRFTLGKYEKADDGSLTIQNVEVGAWAATVIGFVFFFWIFNDLGLKVLLSFLHEGYMTWWLYTWSVCFCNVLKILWVRKTLTHEYLTSINRYVEIRIRKIYSTTRSFLCNMCTVLSVVQWPMGLISFGKKRIVERNEFWSP